MTNHLTPEQIEALKADKDKRDKSQNEIVKK